jgi:serine/threonine protein kinase
MVSGEEPFENGLMFGSAGGDRYELLDEIGEGAFGQVFRCENSRQQMFACKRLSVEMGENALADIRKEVHILSDLDHPSIVTLIDAIEGQEYFYLVIELVPGDNLALKMREMDGPFTEAEARVIFLQVSSAVDYLHSRGLLHRDIKMENVVIARELPLSTDEIIYTVKLLDFGISKDTMATSPAKTPIGTPMYMAPEVISMALDVDAVGYDHAADAWSLAVVLYVMVCGHKPFPAGQGAFDRIRSANFEKDETWDALSAQLRNLLWKFFVVNPRDRFTVRDGMEHAWSQAGYRDWRRAVADSRNSGLWCGAICSG